MVIFENGMNKTKNTASEKNIWNLEKSIVHFKNNMF